MVKHSKLFSLLLILHGISIFLVGCVDQTIEPFEKEEGIFSVYGFLEVNETPNFVRIRDLSVPFDDADQIRLNAMVTFEDLDRGTSVVLEDTVVWFGQNRTHNFIIQEEIRPNGKYRITAERPDGKTVESLATAPGLTEVHAEPSEDVDCEEQIEFSFSNVPDPEQVRMEVGFFHDDQMRWQEIGLVAQLERIGEDELFVNMSPRNLLVEVFTPSLEGEDGGRPIPPRFLMPTVSCHELQSNEAHIRFIHLGPEWAAIKPVRPPEPTNILDVTNGLGFFGAIHRDSFTFTIAQSTEED